MQRKNNKKSTLNFAVSGNYTLHENLTEVENWPKRIELER